MPAPARHRPASVATAGHLALAALLAIVLGGCGPVRATAPPIVDGWRVGPVLECAPDDRCPELVGAVRAGIGAGEPAVESIVLHREGVRIDPATGGTVLNTRSGGPIHVAVVTLADGTVRAIGVGFPGISREPVVLGPGTDREP